MRVKEFLKSQKTRKLHQYSKEEKCRMESRMLQTSLELFFVGLYQELTKPPYQHLFVILWNREYNLFKT
jgi:hypothetical protein